MAARPLIVPPECPAIDTVMPSSLRHVRPRRTSAPAWTEGAPAPGRQLRPLPHDSTALRPEAVEYDDSAQVLQHVWIAARHSLRNVFEQVTIQQLADGALPPEVAALTEDDDAWQPH